MQNHRLAQATAASKKGTIYVVTGEESQRKTWYIVDVEKLKLPLFKKMMQQPTYDLMQVTIIVDSGWGEISKEMSERIIARYMKQN